MILRPEQIDALSAESRASFEERMVAHLQRCFPKHCEALGEAGVRDTIRYGIKRSAKYGIVSERSVCNYTDLMFILGKDFDTNSDMPWAGEILKSKELGPDVKVYRLMMTTQEQIKRLAIQNKLKGGRS